MATGGVTAAQLNVVVSGDTKDAESKLGGIGDMVNSVSGFFGTALGSALGFLGAAGILDAVTGAAQALVGTLGDMVTQGEQAQSAMAQTTQVLKSTGDASGQTAQGINDLATHWMNLTGTQDDVIQSMENVLLTFTDIKGSVFPQAVGAIMDVSTAMHEDLQSAAVQVGKALNDPIKGMTALQRIGVTFTAAQKEAVKQMMATGDIAGAQALIIGELGKEFGGSAKAAGETFAGKLAILDAKFENLKQTIGEAILPILGRLMDAVSPLTTAMTDGLGGAITGLVKSIGDYLQPTFKALAPVMDDIGKAASLIGHVFQTELDPPLKAIGAFIESRLQPLFSSFSGKTLRGEAVTALMNVVDGAKQLAKWLSGALMKGLQDVQGFMDGPFGQSIKRTVGIYQTQLFPVLQQVGAVITQDLWPALQKLWPVIQHIADVVMNQALPAYEHMYGNLVQLWSIIAAKLIPIFAKLAPVVVNIAGHLADFGAQVASRVIPVVVKASDAVTKFAEQVSERLGPAFTNIMKVVQPVLDWLQARWEFIWPYLSDILNAAWGIMQGIVQVAWNFISGIILIGLDLLGGNWKQAGKDMQAMTHGMWDGIKKIFTSAIGGVGAIVEQLIGDVKTRFGKLLSGMPALGHSIVQGLIDGIKGMISNATGAMGDLGNQMLSHFKSIFGIHSPSAVTAQLGAYLSQGLIQGVQSVNVRGPVGSHFAGALAGIAGGSLSALPGGGLAGVGSGGASGGSGQAVYLQIDGRTFAQLLMPYSVGAIRAAVGVRS